MRGHNEGSFYERKGKNGKVFGWQAQLSLPDGTRRSFSGKTKKEAQRKLEEARVAASLGRLRPSGNQKVAEYLDNWLRTIAPTVKPLTIAAYELNVRRILPYIGRFPMDSLKPADVQECYNALSASGLKPITIKQVHLTLHKALNDAMNLDLVGRNVTQGAKLPRVESSERPWYTSEELQNLVLATSGDRFHALWVLFATTGLRHGEALALHWKDVDLHRGTLTVRQSLQRQKGKGLVLVETKSRQSRRTVDLSREAVAALKMHQERQGFERKIAGTEWQDRGLIFSTSLGTPLDKGRIQFHWKKAAEKANIPHYRVHDLRHTVTTHLLAGGMNVFEVAKELGQSSPSLVLEVYGHVAPTTKRKAADLMEGLLSGE